MDTTDQQSEMSFFSRFSPQSIRLPEDESAASLGQPASSSSFFSRFSRPSNGPIGATGTAPTDETLDLQLSRWDRLLLFAVSMACSLSCYIVSFLLLPVLSLKPRKFALLWSLGSILFLFAFGVLQGFQNYLRHLFSVDRMWFTVSFTLSIVFSVVASVVLKSTILAIVSCVAQFLAMIWYTVSYFPLGRQGLRLASTVATSQVDGWLNA